jgi:hypothetical protein
MVETNRGLTKTYNRFHDREKREPDIVRLRELHAAMDAAVLTAYGWADLLPRCTCEFLLDYEDEEEELEPEETPEVSGGSQKEHMSQNPNNQNFQDMDMANAMQQELQAQRAEIHKMRVRELRENLNKHLDRVVKTNPDFQNLLTASRSLRGEEGAKQAEQSLRAQLEQRALDSMQTRRSASGTFEDSWMAEEIEKAVDPLIGTFRSVIGDIDKLGRSPETVTGFNAEEILRSKPVPPPEYREGAPIGDIESQVKSYASDAIKRALASSSNESAI